TVRRTEISKPWSSERQPSVGLPKSETGYWARLRERLRPPPLPFPFSTEATVGSAARAAVTSLVDDRLNSRRQAVSSTASGIASRFLETSRRRKPAPCNRLKAMASASVACTLRLLIAAS